MTLQTKHGTCADPACQKLNLSAHERPFLTTANVPAAAASAAYSDAKKKHDALISAEFELARRAAERRLLNRPGFGSAA